MCELHTALRARRLRVEERLDRLDLLHTLSAARLQLRETTREAIDQWASGRVLEAGSGRSPYASMLESSADSVTRLDIDAVHSPDLVGDVQAMKAIPDRSFDSVLSTQVIEHVPRPQDAFSEFSRVLRPGGILILTAPHLSMIHDAPYDFFRFTRFGLAELCQASSLEVVELREVGGVISLIGHAASVGALTILGTVPGLFWSAWFFNYVFLVRGLHLVDRLLGFGGLLPRDYLLIARRV